MRALRISPQKLGIARSPVLSRLPATRFHSFSTSTRTQVATVKPPACLISTSPHFQHFQRSPVRHNSSLTAPPPSDPQLETSKPRPDQPAYMLTFTCKPCGERSAHRVTKQGYHKGSVLITCPKCKNRHVISDHLKIFLDDGGTLEEILQKHGALVKKGQLGIRPGQLVGNEGEEDIEFWEDGTETKSA